MNLKSPSPLGEKKLSEDGATAKFLEIAQEKEEKKFKIPKITIPDIEDLKLIEPRKHGEKKHESPNNDSNHQQQNISIPENISIKENRLQELFPSKILPFLKKHKEKFINISLIAVPILILFVLIISIISYTNSEPYRIAREFLQKIEYRDFRGAYELTTDAYKTVNKREAFEKSIVKLNSVDISNPKVKNKRLDDDKAMGQYAYIQYKVSGYFVDITMFNDSADWGVHSIEITIAE